MAFDVDGLIRLWTEPLPAGDDAEAAFQKYYTDPVEVNGVLLTARDLVARAAALQEVFEDAEREVLHRVEAENELAVAFHLRGRHVGTFRTALGELSATGRHLDIRAIDIMRLTDGRISHVWMVADELGALANIGAVAFTTPR